MSSRATSRHSAIRTAPSEYLPNIQSVSLLFHDSSKWVNSLWIISERYTNEQIKQNYININTYKLKYTIFGVIIFGKIMHFIFTLRVRIIVLLPLVRNTQDFWTSFCVSEACIRGRLWQVFPFYSNQKHFSGTSQKLTVWYYERLIWYILYQWLLDCLKRWRINCAPFALSVVYA